MLTAIFNVLPEWAVAVLLAGLVWFGVNYVWLTPMYFESSRVLGEAPCVSTIARRGMDTLKMDMTIHTASFGTIDRTRYLLDRACSEGKR